MPALLKDIKERNSGQLIHHGKAVRYVCYFECEEFGIRKLMFQTIY